MRLGVRVGVRVGLGLWGKGTVSGRLVDDSRVRIGVRVRVRFSARAWLGLGLGLEAGVKLGVRGEGRVRQVNGTDSVQYWG